MAAHKRRAVRAVPRTTDRRVAAVAAPETAPRTWVVTLLVFVGLFAVYTANARLLGAGDSIPTRRLPFSLLREGDVDLDEFTWELNRKGKPP